jgi:dihydrofolate reductase
VVKRQRKIIVYIATSADGYIARADGNVDWLNRPRTAGDYGMSAFYRSIDTILWGRKTLDIALAFQKKGLKGSALDTSVKNYVFSRKPQRKAVPGVEFVDEPISDFVRRLRNTPGKGIWIMGGAGIIGSFLDAGEIDEFIIHVIPTMIGAGIPMVQSKQRQVPLSLKAVERFKDGVIRLHYEVIRSTPRKGGRK